MEKCVLVKATMDTNGTTITNPIIRGCEVKRIDKLPANI